MCILHQQTRWAGTLLSGGVMIVVDAVLLRGPFRYLSAVLGLLSLGCLLLSTLASVGGHLFGYGGAERIIVYPIIIWLMGFGVYLMTPHAVSSRDTDGGSGKAGGQPVRMQPGA
jgi:hypothetical protein